MAEIEKKRQIIQITSPVCEFRYPRLTDPDYGTVNYPKENGEYSVQMKFKFFSESAEMMIYKLTPYYDEAIKEAEELFRSLGFAQRKKLESVKANDLFNTIYDKETEEPTGDIFFKTGMASKGIFKKGPKSGQQWTRTPIIYDSKGNRVKKVPEIWSGTKGRVCFTVWPYFIEGTGNAGLKLRLVGVQIIDLVSGGDQSAEGMGFGAEDGGYDYGDERDVSSASSADPDYSAGQSEVGDGW